MKRKKCVEIKTYFSCKGLNKEVVDTLNEQEVKDQIETLIMRILMKKHGAKFVKARIKTFVSPQPLPSYGLGEEANWTDNNAQN